MAPKRHLPKRWRNVNEPVRESACGLSNPSRWSFDPRLVTCQACHRTLEMADAEVASRL